MAIRIIVGAQWGDEGKGKIVDMLSEHVDIVARYQGGANAGHTVCIGDQEYVLHLIPSGIFYPQVTCVIGNGVVVDPTALFEEIDKLEASGIRVMGRLLLSQNAHLILPYHKLLDSIREEGPGKIGTTGRGIGPAYIDKVMRVGITVGDLLDVDELSRKLRLNLNEKNEVLVKVHGMSPVDIDAIVGLCVEFGKKLAPHIADTALFLNAASQQGKRIIAEGAQGALLDVDHGTYPFVTSSNPTAGGACTGLGIPPTAISSTLGVVKAYCTRVGDGPFPTELLDDIGAKMREIGHEYGATTSRPRRCGWFDAVAMRYSAMVNGCRHIAVTKLDVLSAFTSLNVCVGYEHGGKRLSSFTTDTKTLAAVTPVYETHPGWNTDISAVRVFDELPEAAQRYLRVLANLSQTRLKYVSVGPRRDQTIVLQ